MAKRLTVKPGTIVSETGEILGGHSGITGYTTLPFHADVKIRYSQSTASAIVIPAGEKTAEIEFDIPQRAPAAGQAAVFYEGEYVLGGGIIS